VASWRSLPLARSSLAALSEVLGRGAVIQEVDNICAGGKMNIWGHHVYWRWNRIPEMADLSPKERKRLWKEATRDPFRLTDLAWLAILISMFVVVGLAAVWLLANLSGWIAIPLVVIISAGFGLVLDAILIYRYRPIVRRLRHGS
jgi:hypothetical protein